MLRWTLVLTAVIGIAAGCGGDSPAPSLVIEDAFVESGEDVSAGDTAAEDASPLSDQTTQEDAMAPEDAAEPEDTTGDMGPEPVCEDDDDCMLKSEDPCTFWFCHPTQKTCMPASYPDHVPCDDEDVCTVGDVCKAGICVSGPVNPPPDPWLPCHESVCDPATGWHPIPVEGPCDDEDPCTQDDHCEDGVCVGTPDGACGCQSDDDCPGDGNFCNGTSMCKEGVCKTTAPPPPGSPCEDGDPCTIGDECWDGECDGGEDICSEPLCGDGECDDLEHCQSCPEDCGSCDSDCCDSHDGQGCDNEACEELVCNQDVFCCNGEWDDICAQDAVQLCSVCGAGPTCGDDDCDFGENCQSCPSDCDGGCTYDCCFPHDGSGCEHANCLQKVCSEDDFCCEEGWDDYCIETAQFLCDICM